jgi:predicted nucleic acid-binding protein
VILLDTDVLIDVQRGHPPAEAWFTGLAGMPSVPGFVVMELIQNARNAREVQQARRLVSKLPLVWPSEADLGRALADYTALHLSTGLGLLDSLIAATAIGQDAVLYTFNAKHYRAVSGLSFMQPYTR